APVPAGRGGAPAPHPRSVDRGEPALARRRMAARGAAAQGRARRDGSRDPIPRAGRGAMIALVLLVMLAVGGVSHAALLAAREEVAASAIRGRDLGLRMEAEQVLARALDDGLGSLLPSLPPRGEGVHVHSFAAV